MDLELDLMSTEEFMEQQGVRRLLKGHGNDITPRFSPTTSPEVLVGNASRPETQPIAASIRDWAKARPGPGPAAAVDLLLQGYEGRFADPLHCWIQSDRTNNYRVNFDIISENVRDLPPAQRSFLLIVASVATDEEIILGRCIRSVDSEVFDLVLSALRNIRFGLVLQS